MEVIALVNQKGGVLKTTTTANLGIGLASKGNRVLLIDADPQGSLTTALGHKQPDELPQSLATIMEKTIFGQPVAPGEGLLHHQEGIDLIPANDQLDDMDITLVAVAGYEASRALQMDASLKAARRPGQTQAQRGARPGGKQGSQRPGGNPASRPAPKPARSAGQGGKDHRGHSGQRGQRAV